MARKPKGIPSFGIKLRQVQAVQAENPGMSVSDVTRIVTQHRKAGKAIGGYRVRSKGQYPVKSSAPTGHSSTPAASSGPSAAQAAMQARMREHQGNITNQRAPVAGTGHTGTGTHSRTASQTSGSKLTSYTGGTVPSKAMGTVKKTPPSKPIASGDVNASPYSVTRNFVNAGGGRMRVR